MACTGAAGKCVVVGPRGEKGWHMPHCCCPSLTGRQAALQATGSPPWRLPLPLPAVPHCRAGAAPAPCQTPGQPAWLWQMCRQWPRRPPPRARHWAAGTAGQTGPPPKLLPNHLPRLLGSCSSCLPPSGRHLGGGRTERFPTSQEARVEAWEGPAAPPASPMDRIMVRDTSSLTIYDSDTSARGAKVQAHVVR